MLNPIQRAAIQHLVAYKMSPVDGRMEHKDFCEMVGITPRALQLWRGYTSTCGDCGHSRTNMQKEAKCPKCSSENVTHAPRHPEFYATLAKATEEAENAGDDLFAIKTRQWALEQMVAMYHKGKGNEKRQMLKMILDLTSDVADSGTPADYSEMTDEELEQAALNRCVSVESEVRQTVKGA